MTNISVKCFENYIEKNTGKIYKGILINVGQSTKNPEVDLHLAYAHLCIYYIL